MRPLRTRLLEARRRTGHSSQVIERDYLLSWILAGVSRTPALAHSLVFKGGTALKKCYFGDYRFSEDLDFSGIEGTPTGIKGTPTGIELEQLVRQACEAAADMLDEFTDVEMECRRYSERDPHPGGQEAFDVHATYPWQSQPYTRVRIEVTLDEPILWPVEERAIIHDYEEPLEAAIQTYSLEEIIAEKLRAVLQQTRMLRERGWTRSRARDYYDIWRILRNYRSQLVLGNFGSLLSEKCAARGVSYTGPEDFFPQEMLSYVVERWSNSLGPLVESLPVYDLVINELRPEVRHMLDS